MTNDARPAKGKSWRDVLPVHPAADLFPLMSPDELRELGEDIKKNGLRTPIILWAEGYADAPDDTEWQLVDGRNRLDAMELVGLPVVEDHKLVYRRDRDHLPRYLVGRGDRRTSPVVNPHDYVISANIHHRHLTAEQKREIIAKVIKAKPEASNRQIAKQVKADDKTVGKVRREMEATADIPQLDTTGADGKARPTKKKRRDVDDFEAEKRAREAKPFDAAEAVLSMIIEAAGKRTEAPLPVPEQKNPIAVAWDKATFAQQKEFALEYRTRMLRVAEQAEREAAPAEVPEPATTVPAAITTTPAGMVEIPDLPEFLRRTA
jgi:hypothetical protein